MKDKDQTFAMLMSLIFLILGCSLSIYIMNETGSLYKDLNPSISQRTENTAGVISLSIILFIFCHFYLIMNKISFDVPQYAIMPVVLFIASGLFVVLFSMLVVPYHHFLVIAILAIELLFFYIIISIKFYELKIFYYESSLYRMVQKQQKKTLWKITMSVIVAFFSFLLSGLWFKVPNQNLIDKLLKTRTEWQKNLYLLKIESQTPLLGDYFVFNYKIGILTFIVTLIVTLFIIFKTEIVFNNVNDKTK